MKLTLRYEDSLGDWYVIERAEHDGREWLEPWPGDPNGLSFMTSARFSDADVEGTAEEMINIADAIRARAEVGHKRCAVKVCGDRVQFWSPRNSRKRGEVSLAEADELANEINAKLGPR